MPVRLLKPGLANSPRWNSCDWDAQSLYIRLVNFVDDYGRYEADLRILKGHLFALRDDVTLRAIESMCLQLKDNGLAVFYTCESKPYVQLLNWTENPRSKSKYPAPDSPDCKHLQTIENNCMQLRTSPPSPSPSPSPSPKREVDKPPTPPKQKFVIPSLGEVQLACAKIGLPELQATKFMAYYDSNGWRVGRNPMKSWIAALTMWKHRQEGFVSLQTGQGSISPTVQAVQDGEELKRVNDRMRILTSQYSENQSWSAKDTAEWNRLKTRKTELKSRLGVVV